MSEEVTKRTQDPLAAKIRELEEAKRILEDLEVKALSGAALALTEAVESLSRTAKELTDMRAAEWMTAEQAATYLGCESVKAFEKIAAREGVPRHYLSARAPATTAQNSTRGSQDAEATEGVLSTLLTDRPEVLTTTSLP